jgi:methionyl-tRNA synthetase
MTTNKFYITTPIYYANGSPHVGHFLTTTVADVMARYYRVKLGEENVFFTTGLDEHGTTVEQAALKEGYKLNDFQAYTDKRAQEWQKAFDETGISYDYFVRTTEPKHKKFAQEFIEKMIAEGDVYKGTYKGKYCNGCEKFLTLSDLDERGLCPLHRPDQVVEIEEDNYFFKLSKYASKVKTLIEENKIKITPSSKRSEMLSRLAGGVDDISISRPREKVSWGVEFPGDTLQTIYVWVEALINYLSSVEINNKEGFWKYCHHALGKDINWFHNVIWPALLLSAKYPLYKESFVHSFLNIGGAKISKSLGNVITPKELLAQFGVDGARYLILTNLPYKNDADMTWGYLNEKYNADLANGLGNLVSRVAGLANGVEFDKESKLDYSKEITTHIQKYEFHLALEKVWNDIRECDVLINKREVWKLKGRVKAKTLNDLVNKTRQIACNLKPFLPETAENILRQFSGPTIKSAKPLFPRIEG